MILVFETHQRLDEDEVRRADLALLDASPDNAVIAFADDSSLQVFLERLDKFRNTDLEEQKSASYESFFGMIESVRAYGPTDRLTPRLEDVLGSSTDVDLLIDIECWHPGSASLAAEWAGEVSDAIRSVGGEALDVFVNDSALVTLLRARVPVAAVLLLAELDAIATIDAPPVPPIWFHETYDLALGDIRVEPADPSAPRVGLIDSGVQSGHPLLGGSIDAAESIGLSDGFDVSGHGTAVAGLLLYGSLDGIATGELPPPACRIYSVRVMEDDERFADVSSLEREIGEALEMCAGAGARVVNISIGDQGSPYSGRRTTRLAAIVDQKVRELDLVVVVAAGNVEPATYHFPFDQGMAAQYPRTLVESPDTSIVDPAPAALAITVGGAVSKTTSQFASRQALGERAWPAPISRRGPGVHGAIKPEIIAPAGTFCWDAAQGQLVDDPDVAILSLNGRSGTTSLFAANVGTSFAAPAVTRVAATIVARYPDLPANLIRALVLQSIEQQPDEFLGELDGERPAERASLSRKLSGFGHIGDHAVTESTSHSTVVYAVDSIESDGLHFYEVPIPDSFFVTGGSRKLTMSLAYDPEIRARRNEYLSSRMEFRVYRGLSVGELRESLVKIGEDEDPFQDAFDDDDSGTGGEVKLMPTGRDRSRGTNQFATKIMATRLRPEDGEHFLVMVRNQFRFGLAEPQPYGLVVRLDRSLGAPPIYADLQAKLAARQRGRAEAQAETRLRA